MKGLCAVQRSLLDAGLGVAYTANGGEGIIAGQSRCGFEQKDAHCYAVVPAFQKQFMIMQNLYREAKHG
jgi:hypothetical protein